VAEVSLLNNLREIYFFGFEVAVPVFESVQERVRGFSPQPHQICTANHRKMPVRIGAEAPDSVAGRKRGSLRAPYVRNAGNPTPVLSKPPSDAMTWPVT
jgi:hypothetical protein